MLPTELLTSKIAERHGPAALALALALAVEVTGRLAYSEDELAALLGVSVRSLQSVRTGLVGDGVITYTRGRRGRPGVYQFVRGQEAAPAKRMTRTRPPAEPAVRERKPQAADPLFEAICDLAGDGVRYSAGGRVAKLANQMLRAGITAERLLSELPVVVGLHAPWRTSLDLGTITDCWPWILTPPTKPQKANGAINMTASAFADNGGQDPWATRKNGHT